MAGKPTPPGNWKPVAAAVKGITDRYGPVSSHSSPVSGNELFDVARESPLANQHSKKALAQASNIIAATTRKKK